ncbi:MAG: ribosome recycling factor [Gammaproteobacteria bacterium GWE2_42_36]|nr:MAG: ribosome recycling factor [Gammaproteobacteria bacterium GWE2_42_36]HCU05339.1 ribosome recycling factor [Coxiellaceae bacterium]
MIDMIRKTAESHMQKSVEALKAELVKIRTGRAHPSLLDHIKVSCYGSDMPVSQVATVSAADARSLVITPWDKKMIPAIEKAILQANLGLNPVSMGDVVRVPMPPLNEERRKELIKIVKTETENSRVSVRNVRRDANAKVKELLKEKKISEDDERRVEEQIQKLTDKYIQEAEKLLSAKERELMEV